MQVYAMKFHNFLRFGEKNNTIVFDLSNEHKSQLESEEITMDEIYELFCKDPVAYVKEVKERGIERQLGIIGVINGDADSSNGAGKSSIMEGICYAHYEKIVRKTANKDSIEKAGTSVVTKVNGKYPENLRESYVEEYFEENGCIYRIKRGRSFSKNKKSHSPILEFDCITESNVDSLSGHRTGDTKDSIADIIKMDYDVFVNSQMFGQNDAGKYLTGTDKTKKEMLISLLRLENVVGDCLDVIRKKKNAQDKVVTELLSNVKFIEKSFTDAYIKYYLNNKDGQGEEVIEFDDEMPDKLIATLNATKDAGKEKILKYNEKKKEINAKIDNLLSDDRIKNVARIKEEGSKIKNEKISKEKEKNERVKEWMEEISYCDKEIEKITKNILNKESKKKELQNYIDEIKEKQKTFDQNKIDKKLSVIEKAKKQLPNVQLLIKKITEEKDSINQNMAKLESKKEGFEEEKASLLEQIENAGDVDHFICEKCKSKVSKSHILEEISVVSEKLKDVNKLIENLKIKKDDNLSNFSKEEELLEKINKYVLHEQKVLNEIETDKIMDSNLKNTDSSLKDIEIEIKELNSQQKEKCKKKDDCQIKIDSISRDFEKTIKDLDAKLKSMRQDYEDAKKKSSVVEEKISKNKELIDKIDESCKVINEKIGFLSREIEHYLNLIKDLKEKKELYVTESKVYHRYLLLESVYGLDGIQTRIIDKYLPLLNVYVMDFLNILSNGTIMVNQFINDKSKIDLTIDGASGDSYEMLSGGERMIVRLAVDIGLALLSFSRSSQKPEIICLDEIFGPLDNNNKDAVFDLLDRLEDEFSRVLIITHNPLIQKRIKSNIIIEKEMGSMGLSSIKRIE